MDCREEEKRTALLLGTAALERLHRAHVAVFGVGGVGGYVCEALARSGVGALTVVDADTVSLSNINRQLVALHSTVGRLKVDVMRERILDINPDCRVTALARFYLPENAADFPLDGYDYVVDAIDTVGAKLDLAVRATRGGIPFLSAMGAGNKLDPCGFEITDLSKTAGCPLARVMRTELRRRGIRHLRVAYSREPAAPFAPDAPLPDSKGTAGRSAPGSLPFIPSTLGLLIASAVVEELAEERPRDAAPDPV